MTVGELDTIPPPRPRNPVVEMRTFLMLVERVDALERLLASHSMGVVVEPVDEAVEPVAEETKPESEAEPVMASTGTKAKRGRPPKAEE